RYTIGQLDAAILQALCDLNDGFMEFDPDIDPLVCEYAGMLSDPYGHIEIIARYRGYIYRIHGVFLLAPLRVGLLLHRPAPPVTRHVQLLSRPDLYPDWPAICNAVTRPPLGLQTQSREPDTSAVTELPPLTSGLPI